MSKILLVDNEEDLLELVTFRLEREGHAVITASGGREAIEKAAKESPELVLLDLKLADIQGGDVCRMLKANDKTKNIPVVFLTASSPDISAGIQKDCGAEGVITKPFRAEELLNTVKKMLK
jgi:two-component system alkaline phosphatase synthesis response regulator PhoP